MGKGVDSSSTRETLVSPNLLMSFVNIFDDQNSLGSTEQTKECFWQKLDLPQSIIKGRRKISHSANATRLKRA